MPKNFGGRKLRGMHHHEHHAEEQNQGSLSVPQHENVPDRARQARIQRSKHKSNKHGQSSDEDVRDQELSPPEDDDRPSPINPHDEIKVIEDQSMAILAEAMRASPPSMVSELSTAASVGGSNTDVRKHYGKHGRQMKSDEDKLKDNGFKEWIPQFAKSYGYSCLFRFASGLDYTLMAVGTLTAIVAGCYIPTVIFLFGNLIRVKVLADKMNCTSGSSSACDMFLDTCEENTIDSSIFDERAFLQRPFPLDNRKITTEHMRYFVDVQLSLTFLYTVVSSSYFFCWNYASWNQGGKLRRAYFQSLLRKDMSWFDTEQDPETVNRMLENTRRIVEAIGESIPVAISLIVMSCLCLALAFSHGWQLTLVCLSVLPFIWGVMWLVNNLKASRILRERRAYRVAHDLAKEVFSKMRTVIGYGTQLNERALYKREIARGNRYVICAIVLQSLAVALMYMITYGLFAVVLWYGMELVLVNFTLTCTDRSTPNVYDAGDMFVIILSVIFGIGNFYIVVTVMKAAHVAKLCCKEVLKVIDGPNGVDNMSDEGIILSGQLEGKVEFVGVRFTYPGNKWMALNNLSFVAEPNTTVAIVGLSDSGKSTTLKLICKEYLADSGFVQIDGHDVRTLNTKWLRDHISYIPQEVALFDMSIEDNIRMGKLDANFFQIQEACITAGAHDFIISYKEGYQTKIGHKGNRLTPGQKQQLAIARALVRDPKILLLDEPTYALDSQSVIDFMRSLQKISKNRTVILVAHRLATVVHSNMIYVLKNGRVVEQGDHQKLIKSKGPYSQLCVVNRPSNSYHPGRLKIEGFDTSEMTIISCMKTFNQKPILPSLYNNMLSVDPVVNRVTHAILSTDKDTDRGFHAKLEWTLENPEGLPDTQPMEDDIFEKGLIETASFSDMGEPTSPVTTTVASDRTSIDEEYRGISIINSDKKTWLRVLTMSSANLWLIMCGVLSTIFLSIGVPVFGLLLALVIDIFSHVQATPKNLRFAESYEGSITFPIIISVSIAGLALYTGIFAFLQDLCLNLAAYKSVQRMRRLLYGCILNQDISFFEEPKNSPTTLASVIFQDTDSIRHVTFGVYGTLLQCVCMFIVVMAICIFHAVELTGYTLLFMTLVVGFNLADGWMAKKQYGKTIHALQKMSTLLLQVFQSKHVITVCQMEPHFLKEFTSLQRTSLATNKSLSCVRIFTYGMAQASIFWGFGFYLHLGVNRIELEAETFLDIMINVFVISFGLITLGTNLSVVMGFKHINKGGRRMLEIINRKPLISHADGFEITTEDCKGEIEFVNAHFWRPHSPDSTLLKGVNLSIHPFTVTAIVGYPESGKSAYMELLARYYDATGGLVTVAGKDIRYYSADSLRQHISVVPKEPELFSRTVAQNIALGATFRRPSIEEVIQAAKEANAHNLIVSLPEGYETRMGGEHDYLSSAQKQKIIIARALLKNPRILIFDESTSLLDKEGEQAVLDSISMVKPKRTVIMISHRIQPIQDADWVVVMEKGFLEEQGKHNDLLRRSDGIYAQMWRSQNPLQDENFLKGTISYSSAKRPYHDKLQNTEVVPPPSLKKKTEKAKSQPHVPPRPPPPPPRSIPKPPPREEEPEATTMCGGIFSFLGLGIVESEDLKDEFDDVRSHFEGDEG